MRFSAEVRDAVIRIAQREGIDPAGLLAVVEVESGNYFCSGFIAAAEEQHPPLRVPDSRSGPARRPPRNRKNEPGVVSIALACPAISRHTIAA
jgi:hypothetical protein